VGFRDPAGGFLKPVSRAQVASSFTIVKGALIEETYAVLSGWDFSRSKRENLARVREKNTIGAGSATWLRDVTKVLSRRFDPAGRDRPLTVLAQRGCALEVWKPILLWHMTRDEFLLRDFLLHWLFPVREAGAFRVSPAELRDSLCGIARRGGIVEHVWTETTAKRVAAGLLRIAADFGLLHGRAVKTFASYHLPEVSFLYLLHALREATRNPGKILAAPDWRLFFLRPADVERELLRLHQFHRLGYEVAGSLVELTLPCADALEYAERMVA
jgi:hypothetical protein